MKLIYTFIRPSADIPFSDMKSPEEIQFQRAISVFNRTIELSDDSLKLTLTYNFTDEEYASYTTILDQYDDLRAADAARRLAVGITTERELIP